MMKKSILFVMTFALLFFVTNYFTSNNIDEIKELTSIEKHNELIRLASRADFKFTDEEQDFLDSYVTSDNKFRIGIGTPVEYSIDIDCESGIVSYGLVESLTELLTAATNVEIEIYRYDNFQDAREALYVGELDFVPFLSDDEENVNVDYTNNHFLEELHVVFSANNPKTIDLLDLTLLNIEQKEELFNDNTSIGAFNYQSIENEILSKYNVQKSNLNLSDYTLEEKIQFLKDGTIDYIFLSDMYDLSLYLTDDELEYIEYTELMEPSFLAFGTNIESPELKSIIDKIMSEYAGELTFSELYEELAEDVEKELKVQYVQILNEVKLDYINDTNQNGGINVVVFEEDIMLYENNGTFEGKTKVVLDEISEATGLDFNYVKFKGENDSDYLEFLENQENEYIVPNYFKGTYEGYNFLTSRTYVNTNLVFISKGNIEKECGAFPNKKSAILNDKYSQVINGFVETNIYSQNITEYDTLEDSIIAFQNGEIETLALPKEYYQYYYHNQNEYRWTILCEDEESYRYNFGMSQESQLLNKIMRRTMLGIEIDTITNDWIGSYLDIAEVIDNSNEVSRREGISYTILIIVLIGFMVGIFIVVKDVKFSKDELTNNNSRKLLYSRYKGKIDNICVLFIDVDEFKTINDEFGHDVGDEVLRRLSASLNEHFGYKNVYRFAGDEFIVVKKYKYNKDIDVIYNEALELEKSIKRYNSDTHVEDKYKLNISCGFVDSSIAGIKDVRELINLADLLMYENKMSKEFIRRLDNELFVKYKKRVELTNFIRTTKLKHLEFYVQPVYDVTDGEVIYAVEFLARLNYKDKVLDAYEFIGLYDNTLKIDQKVYKEALKFIADERNEGINVNINISKGSLSNFSGCNEKLDDKKKGTIIIEVLESEVINEKTKKIIVDLKDKGFNIAIDDFGTKYATFTRIQEEYADIVKIDRDLLPKDKSDFKNIEILRFVKKISSNYNLRLIVEGVETKEQLDIVRELDIEYVQGFYLSRPMSLDNYYKLIEDNKKT